MYVYCRPISVVALGGGMGETAPTPYRLGHNVVGL